MQIPEPLKSQILAHAKQTEPHECCGFVVLVAGEMRYLPCENVAADPENYFEISPNDYLNAEAMGEIVALVHSHPNGEMKLSPADLHAQFATQLDWWLVCDGNLQIFPKIQPLVGREFVHGTMDCYTLFRDFYRLAGFEMPNFERADLWWENGGNLYLQNMEEQGFKRLDYPPQPSAAPPVNRGSDLRLGDVVLMQVGADVPNHAAIYLGNQMVLHHSPKRLSKRDLYDGYWFKHTHSIWRHQQWSALDFMAPLNSLALCLS